jgi:uncharacterized protein YciI
VTGDGTHYARKAALMQYLVLTRRYSQENADREIARHLPAETRTVRELYASGVLRQIWLRDDVRGAAFILEATSTEAAQDAVDALPLAQHGLSEFTVIPLKPYAGFGPDRLRGGASLLGGPYVRP